MGPTQYLLTTVDEKLDWSFVAIAKAFIFELRDLDLFIFK
jgi:hypothetical protein